MPKPARELARHVENLARPHYVFRPIQMVRRMVTDVVPATGEQRFRLPWGSEITATPRDPIGQALQRRGVFDLLVCETLLRLAEPGETALDAGANIGHMTSLLAYAVGPAGRVLAFEPHPVVFARLATNVARWSAAPGAATYDIHQAGISDSDGMATLATDAFEVNQGSASLEPLTRRRGGVDAHTVPVARLDTVLAETGGVGVMKIDIEGHELRALSGAAQTLAAGRIRDIVLEEREPPPTPVTRVLEQHGYTLMALGEHLRGPTAGPLGSVRVKPGEDPSLLATREPRRAAERLAVRGWAVYGLGPAARRYPGRPAAG